MATHPISRLDMSEPDFEAAFDRLLISPAEADADLAQTVTQIVAAVAREGDAALVRYTNELDRRAVEDAQALRVSADAIEQALSDLNPEVSSALTRAAARIQGVPRTSACRELAIRGRGRQSAGPASLGARLCGCLCARRSGELSVFGADERDSSESRRCRARCHGRTCARW